jgi:hypothetical protein
MRKEIHMPNCAMGEGGKCDCKVSLLPRNSNGSIMTCQQEADTLGVHHATVWRRRERQGLNKLFRGNQGRPKKDYGKIDWEKEVTEIAREMNIKTASAKQYKSSMLGVRGECAFAIEKITQTGGSPCKRASS